MSTAPGERSANEPGHRPSGLAPGVRAETPPLAYWRRWVADAPAAVYAQTDAPGSTSDIAEEITPKVLPTEQNEPAYRVLIVEDDPSQALFAKSVLAGAGVEGMVVPSPHETMAAIDSFRPDLVLMDLHMPGMSGMELTSQIRAHQVYAHLPVVFLTGDTDPERHFEVLDSGADDFLSKPVRPRHLIAAVQNRVRRARALKQQRDGEVRRHPVTGLLTRTFMLQQLSAAFPQQTRGAIHFVVVEGASALRDHYGYAALDTILIEAGRLIAQVSGDRAATRLNDNTFMVFSPDLPADQHVGWARELHGAFSRQPFQVNGEPLRLRVCVGYVDLAAGFGDAGAALAAAEAALRDARTESSAIAAYQPPAAVAAKRAVDLMQELVEALDQGRLELFYQPIVAVVGSDEVQYQTLVRLTDRDGVVRTAAEIVPLAERAGRVHELDRLVLTRAIAVLAEHRRNNKAARLFVPQSIKTLAQSGYADWLLELLSRAEVSGSQLVIDVRLGDALVHTIALQEFCQRMVTPGVGLCLSQYQSNPEADTMLAQLPLSYVRLSAHYTNNIEQRAVQDEMRTVIDRTHRLALQVIGQHVQDPKTAATLWLSGIDFLQGDLVQSAASAMDFDFQHSLL